MAEVSSFRCSTTADGFEIAISGPVGAAFWLEYFVSAAGGYQETGEISGTITSDPEVVRHPVCAPVIAAAVIAMSIAESAERRPRAPETRRLTDRKSTRL